MTINVNLSSGKWTALLKGVVGAAIGGALAYVSGHQADYGAAAGAIVLALEAAEGVLSFGTSTPVVPVVPVPPAEHPVA